MAPGTEFAYDFCARIGPLQLRVVLLYYYSLFDLLLAVAHRMPAPEKEQKGVIFYIC